jgi:hypothetical protein
MTWIEKTVARLNANVLRKVRKEAEQAKARGEPLCECGLMTPARAESTGHKCGGSKFMWNDGDVKVVDLTSGGGVGGYAKSHRTEMGKVRKNPMLTLYEDLRKAYVKGGKRGGSFEEFVERVHPDKKNAIFEAAREAGFERG